MKNNVTLSIWMITYNHEKFIAEAIESIICQQTTFNYELVIGEDKSTDSTREICEQYAKKHPNKIKLLPSDKNYGMMDNMIRTYHNCTGKYIAMCEGDDYWTDPKKLQIQVDFLEANTDYSICFHDMYSLNGKTLSKDYSTFFKTYIAETTDIINLANGNYMNTPSVVFRKIVTEFPPQFNQLKAGDIGLHILNAKYGKIKKINRVMGVYRIHDGGIWSSLNSSVRQLKTIETLEIIKTFELPKKVVEALTIQQEKNIYKIVSSIDLSNNEHSNIKETLTSSHKKLLMSSLQKIIIENRATNNLHNKYTFSTLLKAILQKIRLKITK